MVRKLIVIFLLLLAAAPLITSANAALIPMAWGFPTLTQERSLVALDREFGQASDLEFASFAFPTGASSVGCGGVIGSVFPTIEQSVDQNQVLCRLQFMEEKDRLCFAYPYLSIGCGTIPPMGFL
jgi:hypothetical protein